MTPTIASEETAGPLCPIPPPGKEPVTPADYLFIQVGQRKQAAGPRVAPSEFIDSRSAQPPRVEQPPTLSVEAHAEVEWLRQERDGLEAYTRKNLALLNEQRQDLDAVHSRSEGRQLRREQELNRRQALLKQQAEVLQEATARCDEREAALASSAQALKDTLAQLARQQVRLDQITAESVCQEALALRAREEHATLQAAIQAQKEEESRWPQTREQLHHRLEELDQAEHALARRVAEADQMECDLRREWERREANCAEKEAAIAAWDERAAEAEAALAVLIEECERRTSEWTEAMREQGAEEDRVFPEVSEGPRDGTR